uniref:Uncharacterized protein n=1 Tax=Pan troglodytes TaxID=9598 RepID=A0A2I3RS58_PANTR
MLVWFAESSVVGRQTPGWRFPVGSLVLSPHGIEVPRPAVSTSAGLYSPCVIYKDVCLLAGAPREAQSRTRSPCALFPHRPPPSPSLARRFVPSTGFITALFLKSRSDNAIESHLSLI